MQANERAAVSPRTPGYDQQRVARSQQRVPLRVGVDVCLNNNIQLRPPSSHRATDTYAKVVSRTDLHLATETGPYAVHVARERSERGVVNGGEERGIGGPVGRSAGTQISSRGCKVLLDKTSYCRGSVVRQLGKFCRD